MSSNDNAPPQHEAEVNLADLADFVMSGNPTLNNDSRVERVASWLRLLREEPAHTPMGTRADRLLIKMQRDREFLEDVVYYAQTKLKLRGIKQEHQSLLPFISDPLEEALSRGPGRPKLVEQEDTVIVSFASPVSIRDASQKLPRGDRSKVLRESLAAYLELDADGREIMKDRDKLRVAVASFVRALGRG